MEIDVFPAAELETVFRVLRTALNPSGPLEPSGRAFLETCSRITRFPSQPRIPPICAEEIRIEGVHARKRLLQLASLAALLGNPVRRDSVKYVEDVARSLAVFDPVIPVLRALAGGRKLTARLMTMRRGMRVLLKEAYRAEGVRGVARFVAALLLRASVNRDRLSAYKRLGLLPEGTLGREYWKHMTEQGFGLPGEPGGIPESVAYHDVCHVLAGHDTSPSGEVQQAFFQGGNRREDGFFFIQFAILQFHQGVQLTPIARPETGYFDPASALWAIHRGACCEVDVTHRWNYWPLMPLPLQEARERCGLLPKLAQRDAA